MMEAKHQRLFPYECLRQRFLPLALALISLSSLAYAQSHGTSRLYKQRLNTQPLKAQESANASAAVELVKSFIVAGERNDPAERAGFLAQSVFFYGRTRTRAQASRQITYLYWFWPRRKFSPTQDIAVFAIPRHPGVYKVTAVLKYEMVNREGERMSGQSRMTCIVEHDRDGTRIVGVHEKLLPETTEVYRNC